MPDYFSVNDQWSDMNDSTCNHWTISAYASGFEDDTKRYFVCRDCKEKWARNEDGTVNFFCTGPGTVMREVLHRYGFPQGEESSRREFAMNLWGVKQCDTTRGREIIIGCFRQEAITVLARGQMSRAIEKWLRKEVFEK